MKALWKGEKVNGLFRVLAGFLAIASIVSMPFATMGFSEGVGFFDTIFGLVCYLYVIAVFASVSIRGREPTGLIPWK